MTRIALIIALLALSACGHREPVSCDGSDKRPINAGKWDGSLSLGVCQSGGQHP